MNKTIIININSIVFHIEEDAYEILRAYMIEIKKHFGYSAGSKEILEDIENRIAEMFNERIQSGRKEVINQEDVQEVIALMGRVSDFEIDSDEEPSFEQAQQQQPFAESEQLNKKLMRDPDDKIFGGVCSGLAHYFGMEPRWARVLLVLFVLIGGSGFLVYVVLWIVMPLATTRADKMAMRGETPNLQNFKKSFDEQASAFSDGFSEAGEHISRGARTAGTVAGGCLGLIGKFIAWILLITTGFTLLGLFITYLFNMMNLFGLENPIIFPPLEIMPTESAIVALTFGFLAILIPFVAFFLLLIRILFKTEKLNSYLSLAMFAVWIVSIAGIIYYAVDANQDFREESSINVRKDIAKQKVYYITEKNVRILDGDAADKGRVQSKFFNDFEGMDLRNNMRSNISVAFESVDSLAQPYIVYNYSAKGRSYKQASERAGDIVYAAIQEGDKLIFPSHFMLGKSPLYRDQNVRVIVYIPRGSQVVLDREIRHKLRDMDYHGCLTNYSDSDHQKFTEWTMSDKGLTCNQLPPPAPEVTEETTESNTADAITEAVEKHTAEIQKAAEQVAAEVERKAQEIEKAAEAAAAEAEKRANRL